MKLPKFLTSHKQKNQFLSACQTNDIQTIESLMHARFRWFDIQDCIEEGFYIACRCQHRDMINYLMNTSHPYYVDITKNRIVNSLLYEVCASELDTLLDIILSWPDYPVLSELTTYIPHYAQYGRLYFLQKIMKAKPRLFQGTILYDAILPAIQRNHLDVLEWFLTFPEIARRSARLHKKLIKACLHFGNAEALKRIDNGTSYYELITYETLESLLRAHNRKMLQYLADTSFSIASEHRECWTKLYANAFLCAQNSNLFQTKDEPYNRISMSLFGTEKRKNDVGELLLLLTLTNVDFNIMATSGTLEKSYVFTMPKEIFIAFMYYYKRFHMMEYVEYLPSFKEFCQKHECLDKYEELIHTAISCREEPDEAELML